MKKNVTAAIIAAILVSGCSAGSQSVAPTSANQASSEWTQPVKSTPNIATAETQPHYFVSRSAIKSKLNGTIGVRRIDSTPIAGNLTYHGGYVGHQGNLAVITWGFSPNDTSKDPYGEANRIISFVESLESMANGSWEYTTIQYNGLWGSPPYTTDALFPPNVTTWADTGSTPPATYTDAQIQAEVVRASEAIAPGSNPYGNGWQYIVLTPTHTAPSGFITSFCAYHSDVSYTAYAIVPYQTDAGGSCGEDSVNGSAGTLDGATIVTGHELAEMTTDLVPAESVGWEDAGGNEIADKCAWYDLANVTFPNGAVYPVQPLWSNASGGCTLGYYVPTPAPTPTPNPHPIPSVTIRPCETAADSKHTNIVCPV